MIDGLPKAKKSVSKVENLTAQIIDAEENFVETAEKLLIMMTKLKELFKRELPEEIAYIFISRYIVCRTWKEIAQCYRCTISWCYLAHSKGLKILEKVQDFAQDRGAG